MSLFYLNPKSIALGKTLATAGLLASLAQALPAQSATLSWAGVKAGNTTLVNSTTGKLSSPSITGISLSGGGTADLTLGTIANINSISRVQGIPASSTTVNGFDSSNSPAPAISTFLNGLSTTASTLYLQRDALAVANALYAGIKFNTTGGVSGVSFTLFDVDNATNSLTGNAWQDRVIIRGSLNGVAVLPTIVTPQNSANINVNGVGTTTTYTGSTVAGATVLDGLKNIGNNSDAANVTISFTGPIDQLYIDFTQAPGSLSTAGTANPGSHGIGIGDITYQAVPEPLTLLGAMTAIAFGSAFKRRSAQSKKRD